ncbi:MAG: hypothetical protein K8S99_08845 [Planctomycetes bacterium]|nr:hypothetical protein [Planctomycetota bacterium]
MTGQARWRWIGPTVYVAAMLVLLWPAVCGMAQQTRPSANIDEEDDEAATQPAATQPAGSAGADRAEAEEVKRRERMWARYWPIFAKRFYKFGDDYVAFDYDPKFANSRHLSSSEAIEKLTRVVETRSNTMVTSHRISPPRAEVDAIAKALPDMRVGAYGYVHSWTVEEIIGPDEMMVSQIWLIDREQMNRERDEMHRQTGWSDEARNEVKARFKERDELAQRQQNDNYWRRLKVVGIPTRSLVPGVRWSGPKNDAGIQVAVLGALRQRRNAEGYWDNRQVAVLLAAERLKAGLSEADFKAMLAKSGYTPDQFTKLVSAELRKGSRDMDTRVIAALQSAADTQPAEGGADSKPADN